MRVVVCLMVMFRLAIADPGPLALSATTHGSALDLTFANTSKQPVTLGTRIRATHDNLDWLEVTLAQGKTTRTLAFVESRKKSARVDETIAPGTSLVVSVDLVPWAVARGDAPLAPGTYDVTATWNTMKETTGPKVALVAKTKLVIPDATSTWCKGQGATTGLQLLARQIAGTVFEIGLHNTDTRTHCVEDHIKTHELQSDQLTLAIGTRTIAFWDSRDKSYPVFFELAPGATVWSRWDLKDWATRHDKTPLPHGVVTATATYDATHVIDGWRGKVSESFAFSLP